MQERRQQQRWWPGDVRCLQLHAHFSNRAPTVLETRRADTVARVASKGKRAHEPQPVSMLTVAKLGVACSIAAAATSFLLRLAALVQQRRHRRLFCRSRSSWVIVFMLHGCGCTTRLVRRAALLSCPIQHGRFAMSGLVFHSHSRGDNVSESGNILTLCSINLRTSQNLLYAEIAILFQKRGLLGKS